MSTDLKVPEGIPKEVWEDATSKIIVAFDYPDLPSANPLLMALPSNTIVKIGNELQHSKDAGGPRAVRVAKNLGKRVFYDCKLHDIPNTVAGATRGIVKMGVWGFNVHTSGGSKMMKAAVNAAAKTSQELQIERPKVIGVTMLTSIDQDTLLNGPVGE